MQPRARGPRARAALSLARQHSKQSRRETTREQAAAEWYQRLEASSAATRPRRAAHLCCQARRYYPTSRVVRARTQRRRWDWLPSPQPRDPPSHGRQEACCSCVSSARHLRATSCCRRRSTRSRVGCGGRAAASRSSDTHSSYLSGPERS